MEKKEWVQPELTDLSIEMTEARTEQSLNHDGVWDGKYEMHS